MTVEEMKKWIDSASYQQLLSRWRFDPVGSPWFQGEVGEHYNKVMKERHKTVPVEEKVRASKSIGW